jgi:purine-binding chemotaxis protein CheW
MTHKRPGGLTATESLSSYTTRKEPTMTTRDPLEAGNSNDREQLQLVTFEVGEEEFAIDILAVQEINRMMQITRVPQSPSSVEGVINLRGRIIPVIDLRRRFNLEPRAHGADSRIIVIEIHGKVLGFIVDRVDEVLRVSGNVVEPTPDLITSVDSDYIRGVGKLQDRLLILLDLQKLFGDVAAQAAAA